MAKSKVWPQYFAGLSAAGGAFAAGTTLGWSSPAQAEVKHGVFGFTVSKTEYSWVGSLVTLGAVCTCIPSGLIMNRIGRKLTMLLIIIPFMIGWLLLLFAQNVIMLEIGRFVLGVSGGAFCVTAPMYTTEIAQVEIRGTLGSFFQMLLVTGVLFAFCIGPLLKTYWMSVVCATLPLIFGSVFIFMPESPVYLVSKGRLEDATSSMKWLRGAEYDASAELSDLKAADEKIKANPVSFAKAFSRKVTLKALFISLSLMMFQQLSGINAVIFYSTSIFNNAKINVSGDIVTILVGLMMVIATFLSMLIVDRFGRRPLLICSGIFMAISNFGLGFYFIMKDSGHNTNSYNWLPVFSVCLYILLFSIGYGPIPWIIMAELFTPEVKDVCGPIAGTSNWLCAFIVTISFASFCDLVGTGGSFMVFMLISIGSALFVFFIVPETKGRTTTEIQQLLGGTDQSN